MTTIAVDVEQLRAQITAARDTDPGLARRLTDELIAASTGQRPTPPPARPPAAERVRPEHCPDCEGPAGKYRGGRCYSCHSWRRHGRIRTPADRDPNPPRFCSNCGVEMPDGKALRRGRCQACARYWDRNGGERPAALYEVHQ